MSTKEILKEIKRLPLNEKLLIVEKTLSSIKEEKKNVLESAAKSLADEYRTNKELTSFTSIDWENFYETK